MSTLDELLLKRIDDLDDFTRKCLHLASVLGYAFKLSEIIAISEHGFSVAANERSSHDKKIRRSLNLAVQEGILDETVADESDEGAFQLLSISVSTFAELSDDEEENGNTLGEPPRQTELSYHFCHDTWRQKILSLLLDSYKRDIHMYASITIESNISDINNTDYRTKMRLFYHLKGSGNTPKAADLAFNVGKNFMKLGLNLQSISVYDRALDMWGTRQGTDDDSIAGFSLQVIHSIDEHDLKSIMQLLTAKGQTLGTLSRKIESARAFQGALEVSNSLALCNWTFQHVILLILHILTNKYRFSKKHLLAQI